MIHVLFLKVQTLRQSKMLRLRCSDVSLWKEALSSYKARIESLNKPNLVSLDEFYTSELPSIIRRRMPKPYITTLDLTKLTHWMITRGKWRPGLVNLVSSLDRALVKSASERAFQSLPDISKAVSELTVLNGVGTAAASAVLAAYAPDIAPFMSDEAIVAILGHLRNDSNLQKYLLVVDLLQAKAKSLSKEGDVFTPSDVERALWSSVVGSKMLASSTDPNPESNSNKKRKTE